MPQFIPVSSSSGGASFVFDGVTFTIGDWVSGDNYYPVNIILTKDGTSITEDALIHAAVRCELVGVGDYYIFTPNNIAYLNDQTSRALTAYLSDASYDPAAYTSNLIRYVHDASMDYGLYINSGVLSPGNYNFYVWVALPSGGIVQSAAMSYTEPGP